MSFSMREPSTLASTSFSRISTRSSPSQALPLGNCTRQRILETSEIVDLQAYVELSPRATERFRACKHHRLTADHVKADLVRCRTQRQFSLMSLKQKFNLYVISTVI